MKRIGISGLLLAMGTLCLMESRAFAVTTWTGAAGNGLWNTAGNWSAGVPSTTVADTANFDSGAVGRTITLGSPQPKNIRIVFQSGAGSYNFTSQYVDNQSASGAFMTDAGMTNDQTFSNVKIGNTQTWTLNGSGDVTISPTLAHANVWAATTAQSLTLNINDPDAVLTFGSFAQGRRIATIKHGAGKLVLRGLIDWPYGTNNLGAFASSSYLVDAGMIDVSAATLNLEDNAAGTALKRRQTYTIVNYSGAVLVGNASFTAWRNVPVGWEVVNLPASKKIVLRERPRATVVQVR